MLGPAQTSIQLVMPSGPQAFLIFFLSFFRALRTADLVMGEASSEVSEKMDGMDSEISLWSSSSMPPSLSAPLLTWAVNRETVSATCETFVHLILGLT